jgi:hypothetical protein
MLTDKEILKYYNDESFAGSFGSAKVLQVNLQSKLNEYVPLARLYKILQSQPYYIYTVKPMRRFPRRKFDVKGYLELLQADLAEMYVKNGYRYFLLVTDVFSSKIWTCPLKRKDTGTVKKAFEGLFKHLGATPETLELELPSVPTQLSTDQGKNF